MESGNTTISQLRAEIERLKPLLSRSSARQVQAKSIINGARACVHSYFDNSRPELAGQGLDDESLGGLDTLMQDLLVLSQRASRKTNYERKIKSIVQELNGVEVALVSSGGRTTGAGFKGLDGKEERIATTLSSLVPSAGLSYEQACKDLRDSDRLSFRGAAAELREALRETLDHLAPDSDVKKQEGFKLEKEQRSPTMKQKVRYILSSRGRGKSISATPEEAVQVVEERVGALARSVYNRSSLSTHVGTSKEEVQQIKAYVDVVLGELLEIA